jgi:hypothetical protein
LTSYPLTVGEGALVDELDSALAPYANRSVHTAVRECLPDIVRLVAEDPEQPVDEAVGSIRRAVHERCLGVTEWGMADDELESVDEMIEAMLPRLYRMQRDHRFQARVPLAYAR